MMHGSDVNSYLSPDSSDLTSASIGGDINSNILLGVPSIRTTTPSFSGLKDTLQDTINLNSHVKDTSVFKIDLFSKPNMLKIKIFSSKLKVPGLFSSKTQRKSKSNLEKGVVKKKGRPRKYIPCIAGVDDLKGARIQNVAFLDDLKADEKDITLHMAENSATLNSPPPTALHATNEFLEELESKDDTPPVEVSLFKISFEPVSFDYQNIDINYRYCKDWIIKTLKTNYNFNKALTFFTDNRHKINSLDKFNYILSILFTLNKGIFLRLTMISHGNRTYCCMDCNRKLVETTEMMNKSGVIINYNRKLVTPGALEHTCCVESIASSTLEKSKQPIDNRPAYLRRKSAKSRKVQPMIEDLKMKTEKEQSTLRQTFKWFKSLQTESLFLDQALKDTCQEYLKLFLRPLIFMLFSHGLDLPDENIETTEQLITAQKDKVILQSTLLLIHIRFGMNKNFLQSYTNPRGLNPTKVFKAIKEKFHQLISSSYDELEISGESLDEIRGVVGSINRS